MVESRETFDTFLCVGGPLDGQRYALERGRRDFSIAECPEMSWMDFKPDEPVKPVELKATRYVYHSLNGVTFFVPADMHPQDIVKRLLEGYQKR